jgi:hypothetical protein
MVGEGIMLVIYCIFSFFAGFGVAAWICSLLIFYAQRTSSSQSEDRKRSREPDPLEARAGFVPPDPILTSKKKHIWNAEENAIRMDILRNKIRRDNND